MIQFKDTVGQLMCGMAILGLCVVFVAKSGCALLVPKEQAEKNLIVEKNPMEEYRPEITGEDKHNIVMEALLGLDCDMTETVPMLSLTNLSGSLEIVGVCSYGWMPQHPNEEKT